MAAVRGIRVGADVATNETRNAIVRRSASEMEPPTIPVHLLERDAEKCCEEEAMG